MKIRDCGSVAGSHNPAGTVTFLASVKVPGFCAPFFVDSFGYNAFL